MTFVPNTLLHALIEERLDRLPQIVRALDTERQGMRFAVTVDHDNGRGWGVQKLVALQKAFDFLNCL